MEDLPLSNELTLNLEYSINFVKNKNKVDMLLIYKLFTSTAVLLKEIPLASSFFLSCRLACVNISITKKRIN